MKNKDLPWWRKEIDSVDEQILRLLAERKRIAKGIAEVKVKSKMNVFDGKREEKVIRDRQLLAVQFGLNKNFIKSFMRLLMEYSKKAQKEVSTL